MSTPEENPQAEAAPTPETPTPTPTLEQPAATAASTAEATSEAAAAAIPPAATAAPSARPRPEFGEYAPEGWEWKPADAVAEPVAAGVQGSTPTGGVAGTVPGVPHNLGAGSTLPRKNARATAPQETGGAPYVGEAPKHPGVQPTPQLGVAGNPAAPAKRPRTADRIITALLLTVGAFGALQYAFSMFGLRMQIALFGEVLGLENFTSPQWLDVLGKAVGVAVLALYAVTLVYSIRRIRAGKLTFWVPLVAAVVVFVIVSVVMAVALTSDPELVKAASDPEAFSKVFDYFLEAPTAPTK